MIGAVGSLQRALHLDEAVGVALHQPSPAPSSLARNDKNYMRPLMVPRPGHFFGRCFFWGTRSAAKIAGTRSAAWERAAPSGGPDYAALRAPRRRRRKEARAETKQPPVHRERGLPSGCVDSYLAAT